MKPPDNSNEFILWLFNRRCIGLEEPCYKSTKEVNEIIPRSSGEHAMDWHNRVTLCHNCHMKYHADGVSDEAIRKLQERRAEYLETIGRSEYI
jgi:5-methylcytosine-specific restriction endonuclease McrA